METPRMVDTWRNLHIEIDLRVPPLLRRNIQMPRVDHAKKRIVELIVAALPVIFPWADRMKVRANYSYLWKEWDDDEIVLPATSKNTVTPRAS